MYEVKTNKSTPINVFAGDFPIIKDFGEVKKDETVRKLAPIMKQSGKISEVTTAGIADLCGIAADEPTDGGVVYYLTGEFFASALVLPEELTVDTLKPAFRKLGIFLK